MATEDEAHSRSEADERSLQRALSAVDAALDKKAVEPVLLDVSQEGTYTDFLLIVSAGSDRQVRAITDNVIEVMAEHGCHPIGVEGRVEGRWALVDFGDVVVHVFYHPLREFYDIEGLWSDAKQIPLEVPPDQRIKPSSVEDLGYSLEG